MALSLAPSFATAFAAPMGSALRSQSTVSMITKEQLATKLNPAIGYCERRHTPSALCGAADIWRCFSQDAERERAI